MANKIIFAIKKDISINYINNNFHEINKGYYLECNIDGDVYKITSLGKNLDSLRLSTIKDLLSPTNIHSLLYVNLNNIDLNEVLSVLDDENKYYFNTNNNEYIEFKLFDNNKRQEYMMQFKLDLIKAVNSYGKENIVVIKDTELHMYYICYLKDNDYFNFNDKLYSIEYISDSFLKDLSCNIQFKYEIC